MSSNNIDPAAEGKMLGNTLYHAAVTGGLAMGYARIGQMALGGQTPKLALTGRDVGMVVLDVAAAMVTKDWLVKQGVIPADLLK